MNDSAHKLVRPHGGTLVATLAATVALALVVSACGTRAGNPRKPGNDGDRAALPKIDAELSAPESAGGSGTELALQDPSEMEEALAGGPERAVAVVDAVNTLVDNINAAELTVDKVFTKTYPQGELTALVTKKSENGYDYVGVFCVDGEVFYETRWNEAGTKITATRNFALNPFTANDTALMAGLAVIADVQFERSADSFVLESRQYGKTREPNGLYGGKDHLTDFVHAEPHTNGTYAYRGAFHWQDAANLNTATLVADDHISGSWVPNGKHTVVGHTNALPTLCGGAFDEDAANAPQWCFGLERDKGDALPKLLNALDRAAFAEDIKSIGFARSSDLRVVEFTETCPVASP